MNLSVMSSGGAPPAPFASFAYDLIKREANDLVSESMHFLTDQVGRV